MTPKFKVGDKVRYRAEGGEPWSGLTVKEVSRAVTCTCGHSIDAHAAGNTHECVEIIADVSPCFCACQDFMFGKITARRVLATRDDGGGSIEAAERYFELEES